MYPMGQRRLMCLLGRRTTERGADAAADGEIATRAGAVDGGEANGLAGLDEERLPARDAHVCAGGGDDGGELLCLCFYAWEFLDGQQNQLGYGLSSYW